MNIERRIEDALADLHGHLVDGLSEPAALETTASDHDLKIEVLRERGIRSFGDLSTVRARETARAEPIKRQSKIDAAVRAFEAAMTRGENPSVTNWMAANLDFELEYKEKEQAIDRMQNATLRYILSTIIKD